MPSSNGTPSDVELIEAALTYFSRRLRVHLPGSVEAVNVDAEGNAVSVDVRVDVGEYRLEAGVEVPSVDPVLPSVPIQWDGAGGARATFPLQRGDQGLLLFCDRPLDEWKSNASGRVVARVKRWHDLADAVFAPGLHRLAAPWKGARTDAVTLGYEDGATEGMQVHITPNGIALGERTPEYAVALAEKVDAELSALRAKVDAHITAFNGHVHTVATTGTAAAQTGATTGITGPGVPVPPPAETQDVGSTTVKVKG